MLKWDFHRDISHCFYITLIKISTKLSTNLKRQKSKLTCPKCLSVSTVHSCIDVLWQDSVRTRKQPSTHSRLCDLWPLKRRPIRSHPPLAEFCGFNPRETLTHTHPCAHTHTHTHMRVLTLTYTHTHTHTHTHCFHDTLHCKNIRGSLALKPNPTHPLTLSPSHTHTHTRTHTHPTSFYYYPWWVHTTTHTCTSWC